MDVVELVVEAFAAAGEVRVHRRDLFRSGSFVFVVRLSTSADDQRSAPPAAAMRECERAGPSK